MSLYLANEIRYAAGQHDLTIKETCKRLGVPYRTYNEWCRGGQTTIERELDVRSMLTRWLPCVEGFTSRKVSAEYSYSDETLLALIEMVIQANRGSVCSFSDAVKQIRFLLRP